VIRALHNETEDLHTISGKHGTQAEVHGEKGIHIRRKDRFEPETGFGEDDRGFLAREYDRTGECHLETLCNIV